MPAPRHMRYDGMGTVLSSPESVAVLKEKLRKGGEDAAQAAQELYNLTSFSSAVTIDHPAAYTTYDKMVFGGDSVPDHVDAVEETEWVDGKSYKMGDGFMTFNDESAVADTRRVAVLHSRSATTNRVVIGQTSGVLEALIDVIMSGPQDSRYHALKALSQILFRTPENKRAMSGIPNAINALSMAINDSHTAGNQKCLAEACRALSVIVSGDPENQQKLVSDEPLMNTLRELLRGGQNTEAEGQVGKILNTVSHLMP